MPNRDQLLRTINAIHSAGLDQGFWPQALADIYELCGGAGATLEIFDKTAGRHRAFYGVGVPAPMEQTYLEYWAPRSPRVIHGQRQKAGAIAFDYQFFDEAAMDRNEFYSDLLPTAGFRYFVSAMPMNSEREFAAVAVQRTPRQGHVGDAEIEIMRLLAPHFQQALDVAARLQNAAREVATFEQSFEWLDDGVALVRRDGRIVFCNSVFASIAASNDGIRIDKGTMVFDARGAQQCFDTALASLNRLDDGDIRASAITDFPVARRLSAAAYIVSLRPLGASGKSLAPRDATVIVFIRDPLARSAATLRLLCELFGFTPAEAALAHALQRGISPATYARESGLSPNTVYTHLRRIKEKTGWNWTAELSRRLGELRVPSRLDG